MSMNLLVQRLLDFSAKAVSIARKIREDKVLFSLLVEEKTGDGKNQRFSQDFKTLADVLIQQTLCDMISKKLPSLSGRVYGEEQALFCNTKGEKICVSVQADEQSTANLLAQVLDGNKEAAAALAREVHRTDVTSSVTVPADLPQLPLDQLAIWVDPIDSTAEYIRGGVPGTDISKSDLSCVTVLLGVFNTTDGLPVAGVINQPFPSSDAHSGEAVVWGAGDRWEKLASPAKESSAVQRVTVSGSESPELLERLRAAGLELVAPAGAGYKSLLVIQNKVDAYVCSKGSTYMWDVCAPHGILRSLGGGIISYRDLHLYAQSPPPCVTAHQLTYVQASSTSTDISPYCNAGGVVAYRNPHHLIQLANILFPTST